jgi:predicted Zn-dependent protease
MTPPMYDAAIQKFEHGDLDGALREFLDATKHAPDQWNAWYWAGQCERFRNNYAVAVEYLQRAAALAPGDSGVLLALGIALQLQGRLDDALGPLVRATWVDADCAPAFNSLGVTRRKMGNLDGALES